jgi:uncharacterized protein YoxC
MPSSLAPLDPEILKDNLPEDIHGIVDQLTTNVNQAVGDLVQRFRENASQMAEKFKNAEFDGEMKTTIDAELGKLTAALSKVQQSVGDLNAKASLLATAASIAAPGALTKEISDLVTASAAATKTLTDFQTHVNTVGSSMGGAIASTAVKLISGI